MGNDKWQALCPAHHDKNPSLSITLKHDKILLHCHAGCELNNYSFFCQPHDGRLIHERQAK